MHARTVTHIHTVPNTYCDTHTHAHAHTHTHTHTHTDTCIHIVIVHETILHTARPTHNYL